MKLVSLLITITLINSCKSADIDSFTYANNQKFKIAQIPIIVDNDTTIVNELRFYKITSARNTGQVIYDNFGNWDLETNSKYGGNRTAALIWKNKKLLNDSTLFSIVCDGVENRESYFSSILVFDSNNKNCLDSNHPNYKQVIDKISLMMKQRKQNNEFYKRTLKW